MRLIIDYERGALKLTYVTQLLFHIPTEVAEQLDYYVYALRDPGNGEVFYIGKGRGARIFAHAREASTNPASERAKLARINRIADEGRRVEHLFLRTHITDEDAAFAVEQAVIDAFDAAGHPLTNLVRGHNSSIHGLASVDTVVRELTARPAPATSEPTVLFKINRAWRRDFSDDQIYEATRGHWKVGPEVRAKARYAFGVAHGLVHGAYRIELWFPSGQEGEEGRWGFIGQSAPEMAHYLGTSVRHFHLDAAQNPYRKFLDGLPNPPASA